MDVFTNTLNEVLTLMGNENIAIAQQLFYQCISISIVLTAVGVALGQVRINWFMKAITIGFYGYLITNFNDIIDQLFDGFSYIGFQLGDTDLESTLLLDPSGIIDQGFHAANGIWLLENVLDWLRMYDNLFRVNCYFTILAMFCLIALIDVFYVVQFFVILKLSLILFPLGLIGIFKFTSDAVIQNLISQSIKIMTLAFFTSFALNMVENEIVDKMSSNPSLEDTIVCTLSLVIVFVFVGLMPAIAGSVISGHTSNINFAHVVTSGIKTSTRYVARGAGAVAAMA